MVPREVVVPCSALSSRSPCGGQKPSQISPVLTRPSVARSYHGSLCTAMNEILPPGQVQNFHAENATWKQAFVLLRRRLMSVRPQETVTQQLTVPSTSPIFLESPSRHIASKYRINHCQARALKTSKYLKAGFSHPSHQTPQSTQGVWS